MNIPESFFGALGKALNAWLDQDPETAAGLARIEGKRVAVELDGLGPGFLITVRNERLYVGKAGENPADAVIHALPLALLRMALAEQPNTAMTSGDIRIEGDVEAGERLWRVLSGIDFDWEEHLSHRLGDPVAHLIGTRVRAMKARLRRNFSHLAEDFGDYLTEEARLNPARAEMEIFFDDIDKLREDLDRLEARLKRLESKRPIDDPRS